MMEDAYNPIPSGSARPRRRPTMREVWKAGRNLPRAPRVVGVDEIE